jgi:hypothetical protein
MSLRELDISYRKFKKSLKRTTEGDRYRKISLIMEPFYNTPCCYGNSTDYIINLQMKKLPNAKETIVLPNSTQ